MRLLPIILSLLAIAGAGPLRADWWHFRGTATDSHAAEGQAPAAPATKIAWQIPLEGRGLSSPVVVGERVFLTCASGSDQGQLHVLCLSTADGSRLWERKFWATGRTMAHKKTSVAAPTMASDGERVFALFSSNDLFCFDLEGKLLWLRGLTHDYANASNSLGMSSSPVVSGGAVVVQVENDAESFAAGIDVMTGENLWKMDRPKKANWTSPTLLPSGVVALQSSAGVTAVNPGTGSVLWEYDDGAATIPSSGVTPDGRLLVPSHGVTLLEPAEGGGQPEQVWRAEKLNPGTPSPVVFGGRVYTVSRAGILEGAQIADGEELGKLRLEGPIASTPAIGGDFLYSFAERGIGQVVDLSGAEGEVVAEFDLGETILCSPAISGGAVFVRSDGHLWKLVAGG